MNLFEALSKLEAATKQGNTVTMNYNEYLKMGQKFGLFPGFVSSQDYVYVFKTMMKSKLKAEVKELTAAGGATGAR